MDVKIIIKILLIAFIISTTNAQTIWNGTMSTDWYNESESEFIITTAEQLAGLAKLSNEENNFEGKTIKLGNDIMLNDTTNWKNWGISPPTNIWTSISTLSDFNSFFKGTFDGNGKIISGLYSSQRGLFSSIHSEGVIKNLGIIASCIESITYRLNIGLLASGNFGTISNCFVAGKVSGLGGLIGGLSGFNSGTIINSYSMVNVINNVESGVTSGGTTGGFIGTNSGSIISCYSVGEVVVPTGRTIGGFVGGNVIGDVLINNSYYNKETSGQSDDNGRGAPKTTMEMKQKNTYVDWNFNDVWAIDPTKNNGYPYLRIFENSGNTSVHNIKTKNNTPFELIGIKNGQMNLNLKSGNYTAEFYNLQGRMISRININAMNGITSVNLKKHNLSKGIFILNIKHAGISVFKHKIIVN